MAVLPASIITIIVYNSYRLCDWRVWALSELSVFDQMNAIADLPLLEVFGSNTAQAEKITKHRAWLRSVRHERPSTEEHFRIGVYIRF